MEPPVSLSLLSRTMRDQADVVTHCQARLSKLWGGFFPYISNICDGMRSARGVITQAPRGTLGRALAPTMQVAVANTDAATSKTMIAVEIGDASDGPSSSKNPPSTAP